MWDLTAHNRLSLTKRRRKSQIVIEYAYRFRIRYPQAHVLWIHARMSSQIVPAYRNLARKLQLPRFDDPQTDVCQLVTDWLEAEDGQGADDGKRWLMIWDNIDDNHILDEPILQGDTTAENRQSTRTIRDYLPQCLDQNRILMVTTRNQNVADGLTDGVSTVGVGPFLLDEARQLFRVKLETVPIPDTDISAVDRLLDTLANIPLAITQAAVFINTTTAWLAQFRLSNVESVIRTALSTRTNHGGNIFDDGHVG